MNKNIVGLSIAIALLWSLFLSDLGHAVQTENRQGPVKQMVAEMSGPSNAPPAQIFNAQNPCSVGGKGRTRVPCGKASLSGSGERATDWSQYADAIFTVTLTAMLCALIVVATFSLALVVVAYSSRRTPHTSLERTGANLSLCKQERRASYRLATASLCTSIGAGPLSRAWLVGFFWVLWSIWFFWLTGSFGFFRDSNQTN